MSVYRTIGPLVFISDSSGAFRGFQLEYQEIARGRLEGFFSSFFSFY